MKEEEFEKELAEMNFADGLVIKPYWTIDKDGNVLIDEEEMTQEFEMKLKELCGILD